MDEAGSGEGGEVSLRTVKTVVGVADGMPCARGVNEAERMEQLLGLVSVKAFSALRVALALVRALARTQAMDEYFRKKVTTVSLRRRVRPQTLCGCAARPAKCLASPN